MSMHEIPLSTLEEMGLRRHGLTVGSPSQLSDVFRQGVAWVLSQQAAQPVALGKALERECTDPRACTFHRECLGKCHQPLTNANTAMKLRSTDAAAQPQQAPVQAAQPVAWGQLGMLNGKSYLRMNYDRTPYPPPADVVRNLNLVPLYAAAQPQQAEPAAWQERQEVRPGVFGEWYECRHGWSHTRPREVVSAGIRYQFRPLYA